MPETSPAIPKIDTRQRIELTEGVEIWLPIAGPTVRAMAYLIDFLIRWGILIGVGIVIGLASTFLGENVAQGLMLLFMFWWTWFFYVFYEVGKRGASPGKRAMGLRVVQTSGAPLTWSQAIVRNFLRFVDALPVGYAFGLIACLSGNGFQRLGDMAAGTCVIYAGTEPPTEGPMPLNLEPLAPSTALERSEQLAIVSYLERAGLWSDARREELANHVPSLTRQTGREGVNRLLRIGHWIRNSS
ncbi:RDD family protein [bacterium]|nr:RDD family protein [bacterium]